MKYPLFYTLLATPTSNSAFQPSPSNAVATPGDPGQPTHKGDPGNFEIIGNSLVSAQQIFLGRPDKVYLIDKVENNPAQVNGHPVWASEYRISDNGQRPMDIITNTFCAGGNVLGNGTWVNVGGNQAVKYGGEPGDLQDGSCGPYFDADGRKSIRLLTPCDSDDCQWSLSAFQSEQRWYPTLETLEDGSIIILGGCKYGGYINDDTQNNPTYEFFPPNGPSTTSPFLQNTLPANLYPLTWLLPSGKLFLQATRSTILLDYRTRVETPLDDMPDAIRTYPASAGTTMMPLTPANNWTATIIFCGGSDITSDQWSSPNFVITAQSSSTSCVTIKPDISKSYVHEDPLPDRRSMASFILLPDGKILCLSGARMGTAGYGNTSWSVGQSFADDPVLMPVLYDPNAPPGSRWSSNGFSPSLVPRMYHSSALLLPDGSVFVSGSNPNADYNVGPNIKYPTEYRTERFYPSYYNQRRPQPKGLISNLSYGGEYFDTSLDSADLFGDINNVVNATVVVLRPGFSTHAINMGQRMVVLNSTYSGFSNNSAVLHVSQVPPNPAILAPGPALLFVVVKGVPSVGVQVMVGSGKIGPQPILPIKLTPPSSISRTDGENNPGKDQTSAAAALTAKTNSARYRLKLEHLPMWIVLLVTLMAGS